MTLKKYRKLGAGSYGTVYLAGDAAFPYRLPFVAVKSVDLEYSEVTRMEADYLQKLGYNPYIIQAFGDDISVEEGKFVYNMLMEYASGGTLDSLIVANNQRGVIMPESEAATYSYMLLHGLSHVHQHGFAHCDLKPCNILVFPKSKETGLHHLKIADFGLAKHVWEKDQVPDKLPRNRGTRIYAPPESIMHGIHGKPTDVWSLGCTILEMMTGQQVDTDEDMRDLIDEMVFGSSRVISDLGKDFLRRCLTWDPDERWTVPTLLRHPFITQNIMIQGLATADQETNYLRSNNTFGTYKGSWANLCDLFTTPQFQSTLNLHLNEQQLQYSCYV